MYSLLQKKINANIMKSSFLQVWLKKATLLLTGLAMHFINIAQDAPGGVPSNPGAEQDSAWFNETWFWIAGAAISVLVIVSLVKRANNKGSNK